MQIHSRNPRASRSNATRTYRRRASPPAPRSGRERVRRARAITGRGAAWDFGSSVIRAVIFMMHGRQRGRGVAVGFGRGRGRGDRPAVAALGRVVILVGVVVGVAFVVALIEIVEDDAG